MKIGSRVSFRVLDTLVHKKAKILDYPIELSLPTVLDDYFENKDSIKKSIKTAIVSGCKIESIHGPHVWLRHEDFMPAALEFAELADEANCTNIILHPENLPRSLIKDDRRLATVQRSVAQTIRDLMDKTGKVFAVETFVGNKRLFSPIELTGHSLPIAIDTAHLSTTGILNKLLSNGIVPIIHLSENNKETGEQHTPIGEWSENFVRLLSDLSWEGFLVLEYSTDYQNCYLEDIQVLEDIVNGRSQGEHHGKE